MIDFNKPIRMTKPGMYVVAIDKKGLYLLKNEMIVPILCRRYIIPTWLRKQRLRLFEAYWIDPKFKSIELCPSGMGDGNSQTAEAIKRHVYYNYGVI